MCRVLLLDKDEVIRMLYRETIEEEGFLVLDTGTPEIFLEMIEQESPDIVVMGTDQNPWASLNMLQTIRERYFDLPVILCTTYSHARHDPKAMAADYILAKWSDTGERLTKQIQMIQDIMNSQSFPVSVQEREPESVALQLKPCEERSTW